MAKHRTLSDQFNAKIAQEALLGDKTIQEIAAKLSGASEPGEHLVAAADRGYGRCFCTRRPEHTLERG